MEAAVYVPEAGAQAKAKTQLANDKTEGFNLIRTRETRIHKYKLLQLQRRISELSAHVESAVLEVGAQTIFS